MSSQLQKQNIQLRNLILIGSGSHYQEQHHDVLEMANCRISLLIDLKSNQQSIETFFVNKNLKPQKSIFLEDKFRSFISIEQLNAMISPTADGVIISTEPKARKSYILWAIQHRLPIFMDKPITASNTLLQDYESIEIALKKHPVNVVVSCERRTNYGYLWLKKYLHQTIQQFKIPITSIDIHYAGGIFNLPYEYPVIENHPFRNGYGVLLHSGYHYVDLLAQLIDLNLEKHNEFKISTLTSYPSSILTEFGKNNYAALLTTEELDVYSHPKYASTLARLGETDLLLIGQTCLTNFSIRLFGTSVSLREKKERGPLLVGRARQEYITLHLGHHCSIHISSIPVKKFAPDDHKIEHFEITVMNSPHLLGRMPLIKIDRSTISEIFPELPLTASMNKQARKQQLQAFLLGKDGNSSFQTHRNTVKLLDIIYRAICKQSLPKI